MFEFELPKKEEDIKEVLFTANTADPTFYRTYSRLKDESFTKESAGEVFKRGLEGIFKLGNYTEKEKAIIIKNLYALKTFFSGRWLWVGGKEFLDKPKNYYASYNCIGMSTESLKDFSRAFNFLMQGCGVGASITLDELKTLPLIINTIELLDITLQDDIGSETNPNKDTILEVENDIRTLIVGDTREGWNSGFLCLLELFTNDKIKKPIKLNIDLTNPRKKGTPIKGFGGVANPSDLRNLFIESINMLNKYVGKEWDSYLAAWLYGRVAKTTVAGNVRRSAELMQGSKEDNIFTIIKDGLWTQTDDGKWKIDPLKDPFRMANHTRMFHQKPIKQEVLEAVSKQYYSGEGAIGYAPTSIIRCNVDLLDDKEKQDKFHSLYLQDVKLAKDYLKFLNSNLDDKEINHRVARWRANPCYEILGKDFMCNLSEVHLNNINPYNILEQDEAFEAGGYITASLLHQQFDDEKFRYSREIDPIVGVSFTGLFDFFVKAFGIDWLLWWKHGRQDYTKIITEQTWNNWQDTFPQPLLDIINNFNNGARKRIKGKEHKDGLLFKELEKWYLTHWRDVANKAVTTYCVRNNLRVPNRITTIQPAGSKSLLTGASCGYHPPKATRYIRRITFAVGDPIAQACIDFGYNVTPSQSDKDESGVLLDDPFDTRCTEWLVEIPVEVSWANITDDADIDINKFSAAAQFDFFMQVQTYYSQHNVSSTIELREAEIEEVATLIYNSIESNSAYVSTSLLARYDSYESFPRMPFEPITKDKYNELEQQVLVKRTTPFFYDLIKKYYVNKDFEADRGSVACEKEVCSVKVKS